MVRNLIIILHQLERNVPPKSYRYYDAFVPSSFSTPRQQTCACSLSLSSSLSLNWLDLFNSSLPHSSKGGIVRKPTPAPQQDMLSANHFQRSTITDRKQVDDPAPPALAPLHTHSDPKHQILPFKLLFCFKTVAPLNGYWSTVHHPAAVADPGNKQSLDQCHAMQASLSAFHPH